jgi:hypothetical protein
MKPSRELPPKPKRISGAKAEAQRELLSALHDLKGTVELITDIAEGRDDGEVSVDIFISGMKMELAAIAYWTEKFRTEFAN